MILDTCHFAEKIEEIDQLLWAKEEEFILSSKMNFANFSKEKVLSNYNSIFKNFPLQIENSSQEIGVSPFAYEILKLEFEFVELKKNKISYERERELLKIRREFDPKCHSETIEDFISTYFHSLVYFYEDFLKNTLNKYYFKGVNDEVKILLYILRRYKSVLKDESKQIRLFIGIQLNKKISDLVLEMIIEFIEQRLNLLTIAPESLSLVKELNYVENNIYGIEWNGEQQELCELILELEKKGWISKIQNGDRRKFATSITKIFNLKNTKKIRNQIRVTLFISC